MKYFLTTLLLISLSVYTFAQKVERVSPIYGNDDQANKMIGYISDNLRLVMPAGKNLDGINGMTRCRISIDPNGRICDIQILQSTVMWIDVMIIDGLKAIPPSTDWRSNTTHELRKALVFTFGKHGYQQKIYGFDGDRVRNQIDQAVGKYQKHLKDSLQKRILAWDKKTQSDLKIPMPLSPDRNKTPQIPLKTPPITPPPTSLPKIGISIE